MCCIGCGSAPRISFDWPDQVVPAGSWNYVRLPHLERSIWFCERARGESDTVKLAVLEAFNHAEATQTATPFLTQMLVHPWPDIRLAAARALRNSSDPDKFEPLLGVWQREPDEKTRVAALVPASNRWTFSGRTSRG